ncbi:sugar ABC transporter permease [Vallitalea longa]|uniref:Sugar ABC transporter permease n=1 Tax=Vallitalea longa TaxID=2936439 RepID=A0A9W5YBV2_9FIRM|nr:carbohydrate ABC transporter permease [Vallitalea longa]GKX30254.1 sugar ABC transporter permease [Vallitalea longa]
MVISKKRKFLQYFLLCLVGAFFLFPFLWLLDTSLKNDAQIFKFPPDWIPNPVMFSNYKDALHAIPFLHYTGNTVKIVFFAVLGNLISAPMIGYAFAKLHWRGRNKVFILVLATMMLPFQVTMIPLYSMYVKLGWINTIAPLVVPDFFGKAFFIFLMRQFFLTIPEEMSQAARIDGASEFRIYWNICLPLAKPAVVSVGLFAFIWSWTDFLGPLIFLTQSDKWTISIGLSQFTTSHGLDWKLLMAGATMFMLPMIILFFIMQKTFIQGINTSGLKE